MTDDYPITEDYETNAENSEVVYLELSLDAISADGARSIIDAFDIPLFTERFVMPVNTPTITVDHVFNNEEIIRERPEVIMQESLFTEALLVGTAVGQLEEEPLPLALMIVGFSLLAVITFAVMNVLHKNDKKKHARGQLT